jgi:ABC-type lipoprotein export system ATPase subunit/ABC-type lipoprotein release transport system permease subunit
MEYIKIKNLKKNYYITREQTQEVLKGINISFEHGEFVALLGESGCGKSTFLNILAGLDFDYSGSILINGKYIRDYTERDLDIYRKSQVGIIFQNFNLINQMTALENVLVPLAHTQITQEERTARATELLKQVGLEEHINKRPNQLSGGQRQRVAIARALANNPSIIVADEPTGNLDSVSADEVMDILKRIAGEYGKLVLCVTHSEKVAANCTRVLRIEDGKITNDKLNKKNKNKDWESNKPFAVKDNIDKKEIFTFAKNNVKSSFKRSLLVSIALGIGICSFVIMLFLGAGMQRYVEKSLETNTNKLQINVQNSTLSAFTDANISMLDSILNDNKIYDIDRIERAIVISNMVAEYEYSTGNYNRILYMASIYDGFQINLSYGNYPALSTKNEMIISSSMARRLIDEDEEIDVVLGKSYNLRYNTQPNVSFKVVGVFDDDSYDTVYTSYTGMQQFTGATAPNLLYVLAKDVASITAIIDDIGTLLPNAVITRLDTSPEDLMEYINLGSLLLSIVSLVALVVSAIMIFIVMYISVIERTKEIGVLRALGTRRKDIKKIFVTEGGIIGLGAGGIGCVFAVIISLLANWATGSVASGGIMNINPLYLLLGLGISFILSVGSSLPPSGYAANLDPIEALRSE